MRKLCFFASAACLLTAVSSIAFAQAKVESVVVAPPGQTPSSSHFTPVSKSGLRRISLVQKGSRFAYLMDGVEGPRFDWVSGMNPVSTDDGRHHACTGTVGDEAIMVM